MHVPMPPHPSAQANIAFPQPRIMPVANLIRQSRGSGRGDDAWERARGYLGVLEAAGGFRTFDPQTGVVLDVHAGPFPADTAGSRRGNAVIQRILDVSDPPRGE